MEHGCYRLHWRALTEHIRNSTIVGDNFSECSPMINEISEYPVADSGGILLTQEIEFGPMSYWTSFLDNILEATRWRHMHCVNLDLRKERRRSRNGQRNQKVLSLSHLTNLACLHKPCNVVTHKGPPILKRNECICCKESVVSSIVVHRCYDE